jgi:hypothetical protein
VLLVSKWVDRTQQLARIVKLKIWKDIPVGANSTRINVLFDGQYLIIISYQDDTNYGMLRVVSDDRRNAWQDLDR